MSNALSLKPRIFSPKAQICIVASKFNETFTDALVENAVEELKSLAPHSRIKVIRVPGAFEIPGVASTIIERDRPSCLIALGLIIRGSTAHADHIGRSVTDALQTLSIQKHLPIIHEVLLVEDDKQAYARCIGSQLNRGREAARTATAMMDLYLELERSMPNQSSPTSKRHA
jgi:6,7-dimethyl-8-ribityllumazine synthase